MAVTKKTKKDPMIAAIEKSRGRPAGTRVKNRVTVESVRKQWEERYASLHNNHLAWLGEVQKDGKKLNAKIANLEHQAIGYRSVISYLESKIEQLLANAIKQQ